MRPPRADRLGPYLAELDRGGRVERLELARLDRAATVAQLTGILGASPAADLVDAVFARSEGNPFFTEEPLAAVRAGSGGLPATSRDLLEDRVQGLAEQAWWVLAVVAVAGRQVSHRLLAAVAGLDDQQLEGALRQAVAQQPLVSRPGEDDYQFRHALLREVVQAGLLPGERARLHAGYAKAPTGRPELAAGSAAVAAAELAAHWDAAGEPARALPARVQAGLAAERARAFAEAHQHYQRALELWEQVVDPGRPAGLDRVDLLARAADAVAEGLRWWAERDHDPAHPDPDCSLWYPLALRLEADRAERARARRADEEVAQARRRAAPLLAQLDRLAAADPPQARYPYVIGNLLSARAEQSRLEGRSDPEQWQAAAWEGIEWPFEAAYARFRQAEALLAHGSSRPQAEQALRSAHHTAVALGAAPLRREIGSLAERGRLRLEDHLDKAAVSKVPSPATSLGLDQARGRGARAGGQGTDQPADRPGAVYHRGHGRRPRLADPDQARRRQPRGSRRHRPSPRTRQGMMASAHPAAPGSRTTSSGSLTGPMRCEFLGRICLELVLKRS
jgi:hypothetical protein